MRNRVTEPAACVTRLLVLALVLVVVRMPAHPARAAGLNATRFRADYVEVLSTFATGDSENALEELYSVETTHLGVLPPPKKFKNFLRLKLRVIRDLVDSESSDVLVPISVLHHDAYTMYRNRSRPILALHSRTMARELARIFSKRAGTQEAQIFAGSVLTSLGSYLQEYRMVSTSSEYFLRAIDFEPGNRAALVGLAVNHEKVGDYAAAIPYLERVLVLDQNHHQARLRLALCQARSGALLTEAAKRNLSRILEAEETEPWIRSVAYQELARIYLARKQRDEASNLLEKGLDAFPGDQHLAVQLAAILDEDRKRNEALAVLAGIDLRGWEHGSSRFLYDNWPTAGIPEARATMWSMSDSRRSNLAAALMFAK